MGTLGLIVLAHAASPPVESSTASPVNPTPHVLKPGATWIREGERSGSLPPPSAGEAWLIAGSSTGLTQRVLWNRRGTQKTELYGHGVAAGGDLNGDGFADLVVGTMLYDGLAENEGSVEVFYGRAGGPSRQADWTASHVSVRADFQSTAEEQWFGSVVASAGDLNHDGVSDLVGGGSQISHEDDQEGRVFLWCGARSGLATAFSSSWVFG